MAVTDDERAIAGIVAARADRTATTALLAGGAALLLSTVPWTAPILPLVVYAICALVPVVVGAVAVVGGVTSLRTGQGQEEGVTRALMERPHGRGKALAGIGMGALGAVSGAMALAWLQLVPLRALPDVPPSGPVDVTPD